MNALIISYLPGMFGEFFATTYVHNNQEFVKNKNTSVDKNNRFYYPNMLEPINVNCKNLSNDTEWPISENHLNALNSVYKDAWICLPTHWYNDLSLTNLPCTGIRVYAETKETLNLSYAMWWLKSHVYPMPCPLDRLTEIDIMVSQGHRYSEALKELKSKYQNWKFLSYKNNILLNDKPNLKHYMKTYYQMYVIGNSHVIPGYQRYSADKILIDNETYAKRNWFLIKDKLGLEILDNNFLDSLYEYATRYIES